MGRVVRMESVSVLSEFGWRLLDSVNMAEKTDAGDVPAPEQNADRKGPVTRSEFEAPKCKVETVVVYLDRAEVCRSLKADVKKGENEIVLKKLSACIESDSIRVEGRGNATITEVTFQTKQVSAAEETASSERQKELEAQRDEAVKQRDVLSTKEHRLSKQRNVLDGFADSITNVGGGSPGGKNEKPAPALDSNILEGMTGFFDLYDKQAARLDDGLFEVNNELQKLDITIATIEGNLAKISTGEGHQESREVSIMLEATEDGEVELFVSYVVSKAKWTPKYDLRVFSNDTNMKILYYGMIQQATGEDWEDAKLCLSTAMPSVGGIVPDLGTQRLAFKPKPKVSYGRKIVQRAASVRTKFQAKMAYASPSAHPSPKAAAAPTPVSPEEDARMVQSDSELFRHPAKTEDISKSDLDAVDGPVTSEVKESITSTMYEIARRSSILCDNNAHKVSVAIIDLQPTFEYESVPKRASHAYLRAKVKNTSPYALLAGPTNIFLDNNFIAKADLKAVSPSEDFTCSLGVDPSVKVDYKPLHKYREQSGLISKTITMTYNQVIEIKNTHKEPLHITVSDQLPLSSEEKIKVTLIEPSVKHGKDDKTKPIRLNKQNNIEWELEIPPNETKELVLKYTIEHPVTEEIETSVSHPTNTSEA